MLISIASTMKHNKIEKNHQKSQYFNVLEMSDCTKNFRNSAIYFIRFEHCISPFCFCCLLNKSGVFWLKSTIMNFRRFLLVMMDGNLSFLVIPHGIRNIWIKFQLSGYFFLVLMDFGLIKEVLYKNLYKFL